MNATMRISTFLHTQQKRTPFIQLTWLFIRLAVVSILITAIPIRTPHPIPVWGSKPILGYFALTGSLSSLMKEEAGLSDTQFKNVQMIAQQELDELEYLERESLPIVQDPNLSLAQKRSRIEQMKYNERVFEIAKRSQEQLEVVLDSSTFSRTIVWIEQRWELERELHGNLVFQSGARTFEVFATRYDSKGSYYVALPDQCVKFTNGGNRVCEDDGYVVGKKYDVFVSYKKGTSARVGESGPWNVDDTYWATNYDPTPRRMFADLPLGMPAAQAAYFNKYNGGLDQYGRVVTAPYGIDLAREVSIDIGLQPGVNDWVQVSFLWTEGWGSANPPAPPPQSNPTAEESSPNSTQTTRAVEASDTPETPTDITHIVKEGETLWTIAALNELTIQELLEMNGMTEESVIMPGDKIIVYKAPTLTPQPTRTPRPTRQAPTSTGTPTNVASATSIETPLTSERDKPAPQNGSASSSGFLSGVNPVYIGVGLIVSLGLLLLFIGTVLNR